MGDTYTMDDAPVVRDIKGLVVGELTDDEAALVRTLTPADLERPAMAEHLLDLVDLLTTIRSDEAMAEYVYAIAPQLGRQRRDAAARRAGHHRVQPLHARAPRARGPGGRALRAGDRVPAPVA